MDIAGYHSTQVFCCRYCSGLLHYKPRNTNRQHCPLAVSSISCAPRERKGKRWFERYCVLTVTNTEWARDSEMGETTNQRAKRDTGSRQGKCVRARLTGLYTEVAAAIWLVSQSADSRHWLVGDHAHARTHAHTNGRSRTFWGRWRMCALTSGVH